MSFYDIVPFSALVGKTLVAISGAEPDSEAIEFTCADGSRYRMHHEQDCCETVIVQDVIGDVPDLQGAPVLLAEEVQSEERPADVPEPEWEPESQTWTFYKLSTIKGSVTIRWFGESNGYYSEAVHFEQVSGPASASRDGRPA